MSSHAGRIVLLALHNCCGIHIFTDRPDSIPSPPTRKADDHGIYHLDHRINTELITESLQEEDGKSKLGGYLRITHIAGPL